MTAQLTLEALSELGIFPGLTCKLFACFGLRPSAEYEEVELLHEGVTYILRDGWTPELTKKTSIQQDSGEEEVATTYAHSLTHRGNDKPAMITVTTHKDYKVIEEIHYFKGKRHRSKKPAYRQTISEETTTCLIEVFYVFDVKHRPCKEGPAVMTCEESKVFKNTHEEFIEHDLPCNGPEGWQSIKTRIRFDIGIESRILIKVVDEVTIKSMFQNGILEDEYHSGRKVNPWTGDEERWYKQFRFDARGKKIADYESYGLQQGKTELLYNKNGLLVSLTHTPKKIKGDFHPIQVKWKQFKDGTHVKIRETFKSGKVIKFKRNDPKMK